MASVGGDGGGGYNKKEAKVRAVRMFRILSMQDADNRVGTAMSDIQVA